MRSAVAVWQPRSSGIQLALAAYVLAWAAVTAGCESRLTRALKTPGEIGTLDRRSAYLKVHMKDGELYVLQKWRVDDPAREVSGEGDRLGVDRETKQSGAFTVSLDRVALLETNVLQRSPATAALAVVTGVSVAVTVACIANPKACFGSCPTFYVSDGTREVLLAEGFSSSITPSLEDRDVDGLFRLPHLGRELTLTMKNEALETHVIRRVRLLAARRPAAGRVLQTVTGEFREATDLRPVEGCLADEGNCLTKVGAFDGDERFSATDGADLARREVIEVQIAAAGHPRSLVIASRQTLASTYLFYQSLAWLGRSAAQALAALERGDPTVGSALTRLRNAVGGIEVEAETAGGGWALVGELREMGPLAADVVVIPLPSESTGRVRLRLARGHWRIDYLASAALGARVDPVAIEPRLSTTRRSRIETKTDPLITLPGDVHSYAFDLPDDGDHLELFLESQGYYLEWLREEWLVEENRQRAAQLMWNPEQLLRDVAPEFKAQEARMESLFWGSRYARR